MTAQRWTLASLAEVIPAATLVGNAGGGHIFTFITTDSRRIEAGSLFFALPGAKTDGWKFAAQAQERGAAAVVTPERIDGLRIPQVIVPDVRRALAIVADSWYDNPDKRMLLVGVTGTNGKTTTVRLISAVAQAGGFVPSTIGTLGATLWGNEFPFDTAWNTTPEAHELRRLLNGLAAAGSDLNAMEVSSHGLALERIWGLNFRVAVFTNLTEDHLDFHGSFEEYFRAKARLFEALTPEATAVINVDDPYGERLAGLTRARVLTYGFRPTADVHPSEFVDLPRITGSIETPSGNITLDMALAGCFNVANAMAAAATGLALGMAPERIADGLRTATPAPGRFEPVDAGQDFAVVVDYAHTPDALENVLRSARNMGKGRVLCVVGCGGDRDPFKRPVMGKIATELADLTVFTSDNPRSEDPENILDAILEGASGEGRFERIEPRKAAIERAISLAEAGDIVVIAGKGHEPYQEIKGTRYPFDDRSEARAAIEIRLSKTAQTSS